MKRTIGIGITAVVMLLLAGMMSVSARAAARGETVTLNLNVGTTYENVSSGAVDLAYDGTVLEIVSGQMKVGTPLDSFTASKGKGVFGTVSSVSGNILSVTFKIKDNSPFTDTTVNATVTIRPAVGSEIKQTVKMGTVSVVCAHTYGAWTKISDSKHARTCSVCGNTETVDHTWNAGTVTKQATCKEAGTKSYTCTACSATKTEEIPKSATHTYGGWTKISDSKHARTCSVCENTETVDHTWNAGTVTKQATCKDTGTKTYTCTACSAARTETIAKSATHTYGAWTKVDNNRHKRTCLVCNQEDTANHTFNADWTRNAAGHYHLCPVCGAKKDEGAHTPGAAATESTPQTCTVCSYIITPALGHKHNWSAVWTIDENGHWYACSGCNEKKDASGHIFDNACDPDCNVCGYTRETAHEFEYRFDESSHWEECVKCGLAKEKEEHVPGPEATEDTAQVCLVCGYEIAPAKESTEPASGDETESKTEEEKSGTDALTDGGNGDIPLLPILLIGLGVLAVAAGIILLFALRAKKRE